MKKPNVVLIVMDAVRAQNMSLYGYERETTPHLKEISKNCVLYKNAISTSYWTLPSMASLFTGTYVSRHSLVTMGDVLDSRFITIAEMLKKEGYRTFGICRNPFISSFTGLDRGFEILYDYQQMRRRAIKSIVYNFFSLRQSEREHQNQLMKSNEKSVRNTAVNKASILQLLIKSKYLQDILWNIEGCIDKSATYMNQRAKELIKKRKTRREPFFLYIHYNEAHTPYIIPRKFREKFSPVPLRRKPLYVNQHHQAYYSGKIKMGKSDFQILQILYDGAINYLDLKIYEIFLFLEKQELLDNTLLIITSDHGDCIGEHGIIFHVFCLYDNLIKIPLLINYPAEMNHQGIETRIVQSVDIFPTIIETIGVIDPTLYSQFQGNSLTSNGYFKSKTKPDEYAISELLNPFYSCWLKQMKGTLKKYDRQLISIRTREAKYIYSSDGKDEFYDMKKDPNELNNLIYSKDPRIVELKEKLRPWLNDFTSLYDKKRYESKGESKVKFDEEMKKRLKQLGYI